ncbi:NUDIX domain-containing protein [Tenacibaculum haliotis]|uniref:NUDIX domain-containing protein n=1 Tax=Tenacibaculum haliotis TaxID=1888914 RepID=UPI0021AF5CCC|nr:NUDIX domain-containing protein [Tenacibaculum haliotis]MCT4699013.1 NUDIX domain-containing protein [Tenacibaculum haliotis]
MENELIKSDILNIVKSIIPYDKLEEEHIKDIIEWISSGVNIFRIKKDAIPPKHLVSYSVVIDLEKQKILLLDHKKALLMLPSGGHIDINEMPFETAKRELYEELELSLEPILKNKAIPFFATVTQTVGISEKHTDVSLWFLFKGDSTKDINNETSEFKKEFEDYHWLDFNKILSMPISRFDPHMHRFVEKLKLNLVE